MLFFPSRTRYGSQFVSQEKVPPPSSHLLKDRAVVRARGMFHVPFQRIAASPLRRFTPASPQHHLMARSFLPTTHKKKHSLQKQSFEDRIYLGLPVLLYPAAWRLERYRICSVIGVVRVDGEQVLEVVHGSVPSGAARSAHEKHACIPAAGSK